MTRPFEESSQTFLVNYLVVIRVNRFECASYAVGGITLEVCLQLLKLEFKVDFFGKQNRHFFLHNHVQVFVATYTSWGSLAGVGPGQYISTRKHDGQEASKKIKIVTVKVWKFKCVWILLINLKFKSTKHLLIVVDTIVGVHFRVRVKVFDHVVAFRLQKLVKALFN